MERTLPQSRWWIAADGESCDFCLQTYAYEIEYRCVACDAPVCPFCVVTVRKTREAYCPTCAPDDSAEGGED